MIGVYRAGKTGGYEEISLASGIGAASKTTLGFGMRISGCGSGRADWILTVRTAILTDGAEYPGNVGYAQAPQLFLNSGGGKISRHGDGSGKRFRESRKWGVD